MRRIPVRCDEPAFPPMNMRASSGSSPLRRKVPAGVVSFTLKTPPETMQGDELLAITPEALAEAILKRRQRMTEHLPKTLQQRTEENNRAHQLASEARATLSALEADDSNATQEEVDRARVTYDEHESFRRRTTSRLQTVKNRIADCDEALVFWSTMSEGGWGHLLEDAERLNSGGASTYAKPSGGAEEEERT